MKKNIIWILLLLNILGYSSLAYRTYAFESRTSVYKPLEMILQVGDCSISKNFHLEMGDYYHLRKDPIDYEVQSYNSGTGKPTIFLTSFARSYNCSEEAFVRFADTLSSQSEYIFGKDFGNSARRVSLRIIEKIDEDPILRQYCMK